MEEEVFEEEVSEEVILNRDMLSDIVNDISATDTFLYAIAEATKMSSIYSQGIRYLSFLLQKNCDKLRAILEDEEYEED